MIFSIFIRLLPKKWTSYVLGRLLHVKWPSGITLRLNKWFVKRYSINMEEAEKPIQEYPSIGDLFIRRLKPGLRPVGVGLVVHPSDAQLTQKGKVLKNTKGHWPLIQAKGKNYDLSDFLYDPRAGEKFNEGVTLTYYLCPTDYHRVHSPVEGEIYKITYIPGQLWPVNHWSVHHVPKLFAINERVVIWIKAPQGLVALVMVGATNVGKMTLSFDPKVITNQGIKAVIEKEYDQPISIDKGQEVGIFNMGSTVIMVYDKNFSIPLDKVALGSTKVGESLWS